MSVFDETGCEKCRRDWAYPLRDAEKVLEDLGKTNLVRQARLFRCTACGTYWEDQNGNYPSGISAQDAVRHYPAL